MRNRIARPTPYEYGQQAARTIGTLKGMPYGPGRSQDEYIRGFTEERLELAHAQQRLPL